MSIEPNTRKFARKMTTIQKMKTTRKANKEAKIMVRHSQRLEMVNSKVDATYEEIGDTKVISVHPETTKIIKTDKLRKMSQLQTTLQTQIKITTQTKILRQTIRTTMYLPEGLGFKENAITAESGDIEEKIVGF